MTKHNHRSINLTPELIEQLDKMSYQHDATVSQIVRTALTEYFSTPNPDPFSPRFLPPSPSRSTPPPQSPTN